MLHKNESVNKQVTVQNQTTFGEVPRFDSHVCHTFQQNGKFSKADAKARCWRRSCGIYFLHQLFSQRIRLGSMLMLSSHLLLCLASGHLPHKFCNPILATCTAHLSLTHFIILTIRSDQQTLQLTLSKVFNSVPKETLQECINQVNI